tara:strand:- start:57 stop:386 length:330 start_codon:yes stop_codon:yes gene_type:complete
LTRAKVIQLGLSILLLGGVGYFGFRLIGLDESSAGIASEAILVLIVFIWTGSYFLRVLTGKMTFIEQRKRYRDAYEKLTTDKLKARFDSMSEEEQNLLLKEIENEKNVL